MEGMKVFITIILVALSLFTALILESRMTNGAILQLFVILAGAIFTAAILFGLWIEEPWAYPLAMVFFAASMANLVWLFSSTKVFLTFAFGLLVNVAGLVMALTSIEVGVPSQELETYTIDKGAAKRKKK